MPQQQTTARARPAGAHTQHTWAQHARRPARWPRTLESAFDGGLRPPSGPACGVWGLGAGARLVRDPPPLQPPRAHPRVAPCHRRRRRAICRGAGREAASAVGLCACAWLRGMAAAAVAGGLLRGAATGSPNRFYAATTAGPPFAARPPTATVACDRPRPPPPPHSTGTRVHCRRCHRCAHAVWRPSPLCACSSPPPPGLAATLSPSGLDWPTSPSSWPPAAGVSPAVVPAVVGCRPPLSGRARALDSPVRRCLFRTSTHWCVPVNRRLSHPACASPLLSLLLVMQVNTPKPMDGCQDRSAAPTVRPAAMDSMVCPGPPSESDPSALYYSIYFLSQVCEQVSNTPHHPLGLSQAASPTLNHPQPGDDLMALPLADLVRRSTDPDGAAWLGFTAEQALKSAGSPSQIPPSSPISPPVVKHCPPVPGCFGPQLLGAAASGGSGPNPATATVPAGAPIAADAPVSPSPPPRRRPRRRTDGPVKKTTKPRTKARASGRKSSPGSPSSPVGSEADVLISPLPATEVATGRRKPAGAARTPTHTCKEPGCNRAFARTYNLSTHMRTHTGDCPYACADKSCAKRFKWKSSLTSHKKFHEKREAEARAAEAASAAAAAAASLASAATEAEMSTAESTQIETAAAGVAPAAAPLVGGVVPLAPVGVVQVLGAQVGEAEMAATALAKLRQEGLLGRPESD